jgi:hypothetical protein
VDCVAIVIICPIRLIAMGNDDSKPVKENHADLPEGHLEELAKKAFRRLPVTPVLHEDIEHMAILIDCTPQVMVPALDG